MTLIEYAIVFAVFLAGVYYFCFKNKGGLSTKENLVILALSIIPALVIFSLIK